MPLGPRFPKILDDARAGDEGAWRALYDDLAPPLGAYFQVRGAPDPDDLVGDVFLQLARNVADFHGDEGAFRGWTFLVARHRLSDDRRRRRRRPTTSFGDAGPPDAAATTDVEGQALDRAELEALAPLLRELTPDQREVLALRVVADLSVEDVARVLGKRAGAVKQLQRRALATLHRAVEGRDLPGGDGG